MASIHERITGKGKRYDVKWRDYGATKQDSRAFHSAEAARQHVRDVELAYDQRRPFMDAPPPARRLTLTELATAYMADRKRITKSRAALAQRELAISMFIGWIGGMEGEEPEPKHLSRGRLGAYHSYLLVPREVYSTNVNGTRRKQIYRCSVGTANTRVRYVEAWWRWLGDSDDYPKDAIPRPKRIDLETPPAPPDPVAPTWAEMDAAIDCARPSWQRLLMTLRFTGVRTTQAMRLRRADLDLDALTMRIRGELGKSKQERAGRTVPISPHFAALVATWPVDPDGWLIAWDAASPKYDAAKRYADPETARRILKRANVRREVWQTRAGEDGNRRNAHPLHGYRSGFVSALAGAGVEERTVKRLVGHAGGVTSDRYTDAASLSMREAVAKVPPLSTRVEPPVKTTRVYSKRRE